MLINYILSTFQNKEEELLLNSGNLLFTTTDTEYSRRQIVTINMHNSTDHELVIPNECPNEPFDVLRYENNEWIQKEVNPELNCDKAQDIVLEPNEEIKIPYTNWNNNLFSELGRFKIDFTGEINGEIKTISTNEFIIVKEGLFRQFWVGVFYRPIYNGLIFFTSVLPWHSLGLAIMLLTIIIRTILLIPSQKAMKAQKRMQDIQPRLEKIKQKHKGDQQRIAAETMAVWKEAKVNPMGSCLPMLLQFPFLIAIFYVVRDGLNPDNVYLFYSQYEAFTLTDISTYFLGLNLLENNTYALPLVIGGLQFLQMKLTMAKNAKKKTKKDKKDKEKKNEMAMATGTMTYIMPVMIAVFTASLPAGVGIYWGTSTLYAIIQQIFVNKDGGSTSANEPKVRVISPKN